MESPRGDPMSLPLLMTPSLILIAGLITDLRSRKIYNWLVLICLAAAIAHSIYFFNLKMGLLQGIQGAGLALLLTLPMVLVGVLGAGDMKLLFAFGFATSYSTTLSVILYSFVWAALVGVLYSLFNKKLSHLFFNLISLSSGKKPEKDQLNHIPFTVPLVLAWLTYIFSGGFQW